MIRKQSILQTVLGILVICVITVLIVATIKLNWRHEESRRNLNHFSPEYLIDIDTGNELRADQVMDRPVVLIYFNSECPTCHEETAAIAQSPELLAKATVVFSSFQPIGELNQFRRLFDWPDGTVFFCQIKEAGSELFISANVPKVYIYNSSLVLIKSYQGKTKPVAITNAIDS